MSFKVMWCVEMSGYGSVDIHGRVYAESKEDAFSRLREIAFCDLEKMKAKTPWDRWQAMIDETGLSGEVYGMTGNADDWDYEKGVNYRVCKRRISV